MATVKSQIASQLQSTKSLSISSSWLDSFVASSSASLQRNVPISALTQTALFRVLVSDFRDTLASTDPNSLLPVDAFNVKVKERRLAGPIPLQVLDIEDIGTSLWSQVEAIERVERGEAVRGREIVRTITVGDDSEARESNNSANGANTGVGDNSNGPHRVILQDAIGTRAVAMELRRIHGLSIGKLQIGAKLILRDATVARGMVLLTPECVTLLGGKIESLDQDWRKTRKTRLLAQIAEENGQQQGQANGDPMEE